MQTSLYEKHVMKIFTC